MIVVAIVALEFSLSFWLASYLNSSVGIGREEAVLMVSGLYGANLTGRLLASRLARRATTERLLGSSLILALVGLPILLAAHGAAVDADGAIGQVQGIESIGQILGPFAVAAIAQAAGLRVGLFILPGLVLLAASGLNGHHRQTQLSAG